LNNGIRKPKQTKRHLRRMFALLEKAEEAIDEIECKFMLDEDVSKTIEKIKKHLGKLDTQFSRMQNEAIREYKLLKL